MRKLTRNVLAMGLLVAVYVQPVGATLDSLVLQGILDLDVPSGGSDGKALHFIALEAVPDLSVYGVGTANNGGGTDGQEYTFPAEELLAGEHLLLARSTAAMSAYFGACIAEFDAVLLSTDAINQNGDDAIELFLNGAVIETYGDADIDGTGMDWEYTDSWAYKSESGDWFTGGIACSTAETTDASACPYPLCEDAEGVPGCVDAEACNYNPEATVDDLTCTYPGDACDDNDPFTVFDALDENCDCAGTVFEASNQIVLTGVIHAGAAPKALELYVLDDLETMGLYGLGTAQNGDGTDGVEWQFPDEGAEAGTFIYLANDVEAFTSFFGFAPTYSDGGAVCNFNGNDAIELFEAGVVVDRFGEADVDGTGSAWEYTGGWAYRVNGTGPDGNEFQLGNWTISALNVLDGPAANEFSDDPFPTGTYNTTAIDVTSPHVPLEFSIFPNPTSGGQIRLALDERVQQVRMFDSKGRCIWETSNPSSILHIDVTGFEVGMYTVQILDGNNQCHTEKLIRY